jgi:hypothetical protein
MLAACKNRQIAGPAPLLVRILRFIMQHMPLRRAYFNADKVTLQDADPQAILGELTGSHSFAVEINQRNAWRYEIAHLKMSLHELDHFHLFLEFLIPRMGHRVDAIILYHGIIFVIEYKLGESLFSQIALDQVVGYALDLKNFHETSHAARIVPILVATEARESRLSLAWAHDGVMASVSTNADSLCRAIHQVAATLDEAEIDAVLWAAGRYKPTPTIVEAAQALYRGHNVADISRSESGSDNLTKTSSYVSNIIAHSK